MSLSASYEHKVMDKFREAGWLTMRYAGSGKYCPDFEAVKLAGVQSYYIEVKSTKKDVIRLSDKRNQYDLYRKYYKERAMRVYYVVYWKGNQKGRPNTIIDFYRPDYDHDGYPILRPHNHRLPTKRASCYELTELL